MSSGGRRSICVFCGSRPGARPEYLACARRLGEVLASRGLRLVYGGSTVGLMGALADAALARGGEVVGVIPRSLVEREIAHLGLTELRVVGTMHERKALMAHLSDAFVALPGGFGTWDELFEIVTWAQLGLHHKPAGLLNVAGYFEPMLEMVRRAVAEGFIAPENEALLRSADEPELLVDLLLGSAPGAARLSALGR